jgi:hypothetical protein
MANPFPGVDPFLESQGYWPDFHASFITYWRDALIDVLPSNYEARMDERINLVELPAQTIKRIEPDVAVERRGPSAPTPPAPAGVALLEPVTIPHLIEEEQRETYIEIVRRPNRTLVAVLEVLSPVTKGKSGRGAFLAKRHALLRQKVHLVEPDLLLSGQRLPMREPLPPGDFYALVSRAGFRPDCQVYAWSIHHPLPAIPLPLMPPDADVWVDLAAVFNLTYERGRYARSLDYGSPLPHSLKAEDRSWAMERLRSLQPASQNGPRQ